MSLTEQERAQVAGNLRWHFACHAAEPEKSYDSLGIENAVLAVERIVRAHVDAALAEAQGDMPEVLRERVEHETRSEWRGCSCGHPGAGCCCQSAKVRTGRTRTVTEFKPVVGEWQEADR